MFSEAVSNVTTLMTEHTDAWGILNQATVKVSGTSARAHTVQTHFQSSYYYLLSSIREDGPYGGMSPGGLATDNYEGAVFMDQEFYMATGLLPFHPELALAAAEYRIEGGAAAQVLAKGFGYKGMMFPWTSAGHGWPFGCCDNNKNGGGFEDCIEQHITPDVGFFLGQIFRNTGDLQWLAKAFDTLAGVATWIVSRVITEADGSVHIREVMPIDEWCDQASGCARPGVDDDPQMNGVAKAALVVAINAAVLLNKTPDVALSEWRRVADNMVVPFDKTMNIHLMPSGNGKSVVVPNSSHTVCPEDINYLTFPMGPVLNISDDVSRSDMQYWSSGNMCCLENAGMTGPIHSIAWLKMFPPNITGAHQAFNRSMIAASYGAYHVRNEVDKHVTTVGGHFDNTHFLTGDGGFVQSLVYGYGGLMLASEGMRLNLPVLPEDVDSLSFVGLSFRGFLFDYGFNASSMTWNATGSTTTKNTNDNNNNNNNNNNNYYYYNDDANNNNTTTNNSNNNANDANNNNNNNNDNSNTSTLCLRWNGANQIKLSPSPIDIPLANLPFAKKVEVLLTVC